MAATRFDDLRETGYRIGGAVHLIFGGWALIFMALHARPTPTAATA